MNRLEILILKYKSEVESILSRIENNKKLDEIEIAKLSGKYLILEEIIKDLENELKTKYNPKRQAFNDFVEEREAYFETFITNLKELENELTLDNYEEIEIEIYKIVGKWENAIEEEERINKHFIIFQNEEIYDFATDIQTRINEMKL